MKKYKESKVNLKLFYCPDCDQEFSMHKNSLLNCPKCIRPMFEGGKPKPETKISESKYELCERLGLKVERYHSDVKAVTNDVVRADELEALLKNSKYSNLGTNSDYLCLELKPTDQRVDKSRVRNLINELKAESIFIEKPDVADVLERILKFGLKE